VPGRSVVAALFVALFVTIAPLRATPVDPPIGGALSAVSAVSEPLPASGSRLEPDRTTGRRADDSRPTPPELLTGYQWPLPRGRLTLPFGPTPWGSRVVNGQLFHDGIDLATFCGDRVVAAHDGVVLAAGRRYDRYMGWLGSLQRYTTRLDRKHLWFTLPIVVVTDDGNGYRSIYAHFERLAVRAGQRVRAGQLLGYEGATGRASGCHLHYGLYSPRESATFGLESGVASRMRLPLSMIARIDPLLVLPKREKPSKPAPAGPPPVDEAPTLERGA
jgi:murein DD-endopeptidase MepM/ murein hydrolase activator NlpD